MEEEFKDKEIYLKDHDQTEYVFRIILEEEMIKFWLRENKIYAPFTFEASFTLQDMIDHHKVFRACDDLEEIHKHLLNLCDKGKVKLYACGPDSERNIIFQVNFIANENEDTNDFVVTLKMTEEKDRDLLELYKIQKKYTKCRNKIIGLAIIGVLSLLIYTLIYLNINKRALE